MFQKRAPPEDVAGSDAKKLRSDLTNLFLTNTVSAGRTQSLWQHSQNLAVTANEHDPALRRLAKKQIKKNLSRDLTREFLRGSLWPSLYYAEITVFDVKRSCEKSILLPIILPHELLHQLSEKALSPEALLTTTGLSGDARRHLQQACLELNKANLVPLGLWGDGVPCNYDRSQSLDVFCMSLPGLSGNQANMRLPLTAVNTRFVLKRKTFDDIMRVIKWSLQCCAEGCMPSCRHDGTPFTVQDTKRSKLQGKEFTPGVLVEVRGDWPFYKHLVRFPQFNEVDGCCWKCKVAPNGIRDCSSTAPWRQHDQRLDHWGLVARIIQQGMTVSPLFGAPCVRSSIFQVDWLHTSDKGVCADFLGNLFTYLLKFYGGASNKERCGQLFLELQGWYRTQQVDSKLDWLTPGMLNIGKKPPPKLNCKAAEARALVPFALWLCNKWLINDDITETAMKKCAGHLQGCYTCLTRATFDHLILKEESRKLCILLVALEKASPNNRLWRVMPKLHLFQEMCEMQEVCPSTCWTYRDEDFGGTLMQVGRRRGGSNNCKATATNCLLKFMANNPLPVLE